MEALLDLRHEVSGAEIEIAERHVDLEHLLAITHLGGALDCDVALEPVAQPPRGKRQAWLGGWREVPVYALDGLKPGHSLAGPAIIEAETTTV
ncbi:MAG: hypothetical protein ACK5E0_17850, partial [Bradyrhizobium sp.]|uniref:hypothetical protein n=1 Tax=Bradyrhizobium sp. TaxID=376 RepID=UPI00391D9BAC